MKTQVIIPAAGLGARLNSSIPKALIPLRKIPLIVYSLKVFESSRKISSVIIAGPEGHLKNLQKLAERYRLKKVKFIISGGATRSESVSHALGMLDDDTKIVVVHDAARPFLNRSILEKALALMQKEKAVAVAVPVKPTIKRVNKKSFYVTETLDRSELWDIQTPQVFQKEILVKAHSKMLCLNPSDDAVLVEKMGVRVKICPGEYRNIKITTPEDFVLAEIFLRK